MTMPTKAQIDALFDAGANVMPGWTTFRLSRSEAYMAAGLNADGSEKPKLWRVALIHESGIGGFMCHGTWDGTTFTPDGAP